MKPKTGFESIQSKTVTEQIQLIAIAMQMLTNRQLNQTVKADHLNIKGYDSKSYSNIENLKALLNALQTHINNPENQTDLEKTMFAQPGLKSRFEENTDGSPRNALRLFKENIDKSIKGLKHFEKARTIQTAGGLISVACALTGFIALGGLYITAMLSIAFPPSLVLIPAIAFTAALIFWAATTLTAKGYSYASKRQLKTQDHHVEPYPSINRSETSYITPYHFFEASDIRDTTREIIQKEQQRNSL